MSRGADGLTAEELRRGRAGWWDDSFTRALLAAIPESAEVLVEVGCGLGKVAVELLPLAPRLRYVGLDLDRDRILEARTAFNDQEVAARVRFAAARGEALPLVAGSVDCVLTAMTLMHVAEPLVVLGEALRALRPGGVLVAAEPDNVSQRWYFDGLQEGVTRAFSALARRSRTIRSPADLSIGPRVPALASEAGFDGVEMRVHAVYASRFEPAAQCAATWRQILTTMTEAVALPADCAEIAACAQAIDEWLAGTDPERAGYCGSVVPMFVTTGRKGQTEAD